MMNAMMNAADMKWQEYTELIAKFAAKSFGSLCSSQILTLHIYESIIRSDDPEIYLEIQEFIFFCVC